jgi:hypothetical protein
LLILFGQENMSSTIAILLAAWLVLDAAFITTSCYVTADQASGAEPDLVRYQRVFTGIKERYC